MLDPNAGAHAREVKDFSRDPYVAGFGSVQMAEVEGVVVVEGVVAAEGVGVSAAAEGVADDGVAVEVDVAEEEGASDVTSCDEEGDGASVFCCVPCCSVATCTASESLTLSYPRCLQSATLQYVNAVFVPLHSVSAIVPSTYEVVPLL